MLSSSKKKKPLSYQPKILIPEENSEEEVLGFSLIKQEKVGCLILAGGLGTRFGVKGPKGCVPISPIQKKTLFQLAFEKIASLQKMLRCQLPVLLGVSNFTKEETYAYLKENRFFGLKKSQVTLIEQKNYFCLDSERKRLEMASPNGTGGFIEELLENPILKEWMKQDIEYLEILPIDNPLLYPFDPHLIGRAYKKKAEVVLQAFPRKWAHEEVGLILQKGKKIAIIDYMEVPQEILAAKKEKKLLGNVGHYCIKLSFLKKLKNQKISLPVHWVEKTVEVSGTKESVWKAEKFIFDILRYSSKVQVLCSPRAYCYGPLKGKSGPHNLTSVQRALLHKYRLLYEKISGRKAPKHIFELSSDFWYPTQSMLRKWKGKSLPKQSYIVS